MTDRPPRRRGRVRAGRGPGPGLDRRARRAVGVMALLDGVRALGWILLAESLARLLTSLAMTLDPEASAQLFQLLFMPPAPVGPVGPVADVAGVVVLGAAGVVLRALADQGQHVAGRRAALGAQVGIRRELVAHRLAATDGTRPRSGADAVLVTHGLAGLDDYYTEVLPALASAAVVPPMLGVWILTRDGVSAAVVLLTVPLIPFFMVLIGRHTQERIAAAQDGLDRISGQLLELARGLPVLVGLRRAGVQRRALEKASERYHAATLGTLRTAFVSGLALELIASLSVAIMAVFIGVRLVYGQMDLYSGLVVLVLAAEVYLPLREVGSAYHSSEDGRAAAERAAAAVAEPVPTPALASLAWPGPETGQDHGTDGGMDDGMDDRTPAAGTVLLRDVSVSRGPRPVVRGADLTLRPGGLTVLGSASGAGKSTLLHLLAGVLRTPDVAVSGTVAGVDSDRTLWVGQHPRFLEATVDAELDAAAGGALAAPVRREVLRAAALADFGARAPHELSPGEQRRVALARAMSRLAADRTAVETRPWLVLLDEPTAHLDDASAAVVRATVGALARGAVPGLPTPPAAVLAASHDPVLQRAADALVDVEGRPLAPGADAAPYADPDAAGPPLAAGAPDDAGPGDAPDAPRGEGSEGRPSLRAVLAVLPWGAPRLWAGVGWATLTHLAAALLAGLSGWLIVTAAGRPPILYLLSVIVLVRGFGLFRAVFRYADRLATHDAVLRWASELRLRLWDAMGRRPALWSRLSRADGALSVLLSDVDALRDAAPRVLVPVPAAVLAWAVTALLIGGLAPELAVTALVPGAVGLLVIPVVVAALDRRDTLLTARRRAALLDRVSAVLGAAPDLHGLGRTREAAAALTAWDEDLQRPQRRAAWVAGLGRALAVLASGGAALAAALTATQTGTSTPVAAFVVFLALSWAEPLGALAQAAQQTGTLVDQARQAAGLLGVEDEAASGATSAAPDEAAASAAGSSAPAGRITGVRLEDAAYAYPGSTRVLWSGLDVALESGQTAAVTGPSGAGKSTLLAVLLGFLTPTAGRHLLTVERDGVSREAPADPAALARVAWTPQDALVFDSTVRGNLALARDADDAPTDAELADTLRLVGLGRWLDAAPDGLDTPVGPGGDRLSGGERQRLAVARALVARADVVLLDEPTAHVGQDEALALMADLRRALAGRIAVVATHDPRVAAAADVRVRLGGDAAGHP